MNIDAAEVYSDLRGLLLRLVKAHTRIADALEQIAQEGIGIQAEVTVHETVVVELNQEEES